MEDALRTVVRAGGWLATYCDRVEHNEPAALDTVRAAGEALRAAAAQLAAAIGVSLVEAYSERLRGIERNHLLRGVAAPQPAQSLTPFSTLRELQAVQVEHDRYYHPDVFGMPKVEQLRHYALHVVKLAALLADSAEDASEWPDFERRRLPDLLLFGLKISTVANEPLTDGRPAAEVLANPLSSG
jgi:hypothetical protein